MLREVEVLEGMTRVSGDKTDSTHGSEEVSKGGGREYAYLRRYFLKVERNYSFVDEQ
jgi:hypothetical protein